MKQDYNYINEDGVKVKQSQRNHIEEGKDMEMDSEI